jgi:hypothetical protein
MPNWASGQSPQAWFFQPVVQNGIENLSVDISAISSGATSCVEMFNAYESWAHGIACNGARYGAINDFEGTHNVIENNYYYTSTGTGNCGPGDACGARTYIESYGLIQNNISQGYFDGGVFFDGEGGVGNAVFANVILKTDGNNGTLNNAITEHTTNLYNLFDQNYTPNISQDSTHGLSGMGTRLRNFVLGWESVPSNPVAGSAVVDCQGSRYSNEVANVIGTPGYTTTYLTTTGANAAAYGLGNCGGTPPADSRTNSTALRWANYDVPTATANSGEGRRFCGNSLDTGFTAICSSTSESPTAASTYPNFVPVVGDTAIGEPALPASFIYTSRPSWWSASIPFPAIGPDVSGGNLGQCSGSLNTVGQFNGMPALTNSQCGGHGITASAWGGHVNAIPALACYLNTMGGAPDGSSGVLAFDAGICYSGSAGSPIATFTPASPINVGQAPVGLSSNPIAVTLQNTGTANLVVTAVSLGSAQFSLTSNTCGSPATITNGIPGTGFTLTPGQSCGFNVVYTPATPNFTNTTSVFFSPGASNPDVLNLSGVSTGPPAPATVMFAGRVNTGSLCKAVPATTQLCYAMDCGCMWLSMSGGAFLQMGVASVNGKKGNVVLGIQ